MAKNTEVTVNDTLFIVHPLNAFEALEIFGDLQKELLPAIGDLLTAAIADKAPAPEESESQDAEMLTTAISKLSERLSGKQLTAWSERLLTKDTVSVEINGTLMPLDAAAKRLAFKEFTDILELLFRVIQVNFAGPLVGFLSRFGLDLTQIKTAKGS